MSIKIGKGLKIAALGVGFCFAAAYMRQAAPKKIKNFLEESTPDFIKNSRSAVPNAPIMTFEEALSLKAKIDSAYQKGMIDGAQKIRDSVKAVNIQKALKKLPK